MAERVLLPASGSCEHCGMPQPGVSCGVCHGRPSAFAGLPVDEVLDEVRRTRTSVIFRSARAAVVLTWLVGIAIVFGSRT